MFKDFANIHTFLKKQAFLKNIFIMMPEINNRIKQLIDNKTNGIVKKFAEKIGLPQQTINRLFIIDKRTNKYPIATTEILQKISEMYVDISPEWLITGCGSMFRSEPIFKVKKMVSAKRGEGIPLIPIDAVAGWNGADQEGVDLANCESYHIPDFTSAGAEYLVRVSGSSMYPKYSSGDILACKKIKEITFFQWGKIYVIDSAQGPMVKRLFPCEKSNCVICKSDNEKYPPFDLPKTEIRSLSIVIGVIRLE